MKLRDIEKVHRLLNQRKWLLSVFEDCQNAKVLEVSIPHRGVLAHSTRVPLASDADWIKDSVLKKLRADLIGVEKDMAALGVDFEGEES